MRSSSLKKYTIFSLFFTAAALLALIIHAKVALGAGLALVYACGNGWLVGNRLFPEERRGWRLFFGIMTLTVGLTVFGGVAYYLYRFDALATAIAVLAVPPLLFAIPRPKPPDADSVFKVRDSGHRQTSDPYPAASGAIALAAATASVVVAILGFALLAVSRSEQSLRSPWDAVPQLFFVVFFLCVVLAVASVLSGRLAGLAIVPPSVIALLLTGVAASVYAVGFGFDPFIHGVAESSVIKTGVILPKTPYYTGQYVLIAAVARITGLSATAADRWLVPLLFTAAVPCAYWALKRAFGWQPWQASIASMGVLLLPASQFIMTTPQGMANALVLIMALLSMPSALGDDSPHPLLALLAAAALMTHPLAGLPAAAFVVLLFVFKSGLGQKKLWPAAIVLTALAALAVPTAFLLGAGRSGTDVILQGSGAGTAEAIVQGLKGGTVESRRFLGLLDLAYAWRNIRQPLILLAGALGFVLAFRKRRGAAVFALVFAACLASYALMRSAVSFQSLISYERFSYAERLIELGVLLAAPLALYAFGVAAAKVSRAPAPLTVGLVAIIAALTVSSLYLAYPRRDKYESSRGWSTGASDFKAVRLIAGDAGSKPYIVLANQSVSAAAVSSFGFSKYYRWDDPSKPDTVFYYPVPTGGPLYSYFLKANEQFGSRDAILAAMDLAGVDTAYFVVNNYWWQAGRTVASAKKQADANWNVNDEDFVFRYDR